MNSKILFIVLLIISSVTFTSKGSTRWSVDQANEWYKKQDFLMGCNFIPSTAINQIEMWQESTWDPETINKELGWASKIGFNTVRVFLHNLVFENEGDDFLERMDDFLDIASKHNIKTMFVFWDDCHWAEPTIGQQPAPIKGVHNSGWKQSPGYHILKAHKEGYLDPKILLGFENYISTILKRFKNDERVLAWDLYNEVGQGLNGDNSLELLLLTWKWAWKVRPSQPLTACTYGADSKIGRAINAANSDVYSFHSYEASDKIIDVIEKVRKESEGRPILCSEYLARTEKNTFEGSLPVFKEENIGNWCWGFVDGKTGTKWGWNTRKLQVGASRPIPTKDPNSVQEDPELWFHDVLKADGTPYKQSEIDFIRGIRNEKSSQKEKR